MPPKRPGRGGLENGFGDCVWRVPRLDGPAAVVEIPAVYMNWKEYPEGKGSREAFGAKSFLGCCAISCYNDAVLLERSSRRIEGSWVG